MTMQDCSGSGRGEQAAPDALRTAALSALVVGGDCSILLGIFPAAFESLARSPRLLGVSVADFRPDLDPTGELAVRVLAVLERTLP